MDVPRKSDRAAIIAALHGSKEGVDRPGDASALNRHAGLDPASTTDANLNAAAVIRRERQ